MITRYNPGYSQYLPLNKRLTGWYKAIFQRGLHVLYITLNFEMICGLNLWIPAFPAIDNGLGFHLPDRV